MTSLRRTTGLITLIALLWSVDGRTEPAGADTTQTPTYEDVLRSIRARTDKAVSRDALTVGRGHRDSVVAAFQDRVARDGLSRAVDQHATRRGRWRSGLSTDFQAAQVTYSKVDGLTLGMPVEWGFAGPGVRGHVGGLIAYAFGSGGVRFRQGVLTTWKGVDWSVRAERLTVPFGWTRVHGTRVFALAGADEQHYLERRAVSGGFAFPLFDRTRLHVEYTAGDDRPMRARDVLSFAGEEGIAARNPAASRGDFRALSLRVGRDRFHSPRFWGALSFQTAGRDLGGDFDYDKLAVEVGRTIMLPTGDDIALRVRGQAAAGPSLPVQALADPAGRSGVRGYPQSAAFGSHALSAHADVHLGRDVFSLLHVPVLRNLRLQLVPFLDVGSAWTPDRNRTLGDAALPESSAWKWGAGLGVRRNVGFGHLLSHVRLDAAWRLDRPAPRPVFYFVLEGEPFD